MRLTDTMRDALDEARRGPLRRVHDDKPGAPPWPAPAVTLHALVRHGLVVVGRVRNAKGWHVDTWTITKAGREALIVRVVMRDTPRLLRIASGSTRVMQRGEWVDTRMPEPERMEPDERWARDGAERHAEADDQKARARQLGRNARAA